MEAVSRSVTIELTTTNDLSYESDGYDYQADDVKDLMELERRIEVDSDREQQKIKGRPRTRSYRRTWSCTRMPQALCFGTLESPFKTKSRNN